MFLVFNNCSGRWVKMLLVVTVFISSVGQLLFTLLSVATGFLLSKKKKKKTRLHICHTCSNTLQMTAPLTMHIVIQPFTATTF